MKNLLIKNKFKKKVIFYFIFICFLLPPINQCIANQKPNTTEKGILEESTLVYFGFIIPMTGYENATIENQITCKNRHLANDLLREQIPVFWSSENFSAYITDIKLSNYEEMFFEKGTFIVPFTGNYTLDIKLLAMIWDYNQSSEIDNNNEIKAHVYLINQAITIQAYQLSEVKIAQYQSLFADGEEHYLEVSRNCGFLTFDFLPEIILNKKLNNKAYNVIMWGGSCQGYSSFHEGLTGNIYQIREDLTYKISRTIRGFVANGGGYIGSCYGAYSAACGIYIGSIPIYLKKQAYNPNLNSLVLLALSDLIVKMVTELPPPNIEAKIIDKIHPVTYGLDTIIEDKYIGGPQFAHLGENAHVIARFHNIDNYLNDTPSWLSSRFGKGKVVFFSTHPETLCWKQGLTGYIGNTAISNALYYTTSNEVTDLNTINSINISFISKIWEKTVDLFNDVEESDVLSDIKTRINDTISSNDELKKNLSTILKIIKDIDPDLPNNFLGYGSTYWVIFYFNLFNTYLENTTKTLTLIEKIYPLLENNTDFIHVLELLKDDISQHINETQNICIKCNKLCVQYKNMLDKYNKSQNLPGRLALKIFKFFAKDNAFKLYRESVKGYRYIPQTYFNSLKLLRNNWYNYETSVVV